MTKKYVLLFLFFFLITLYFGCMKKLKTNRIFEDQVLLLPFEEGFGDTTYDKSIYQNHADLLNVEWVAMDQNWAIAISENNSYARVNSTPVLNGTHGVKISVRILMFETTTRRERIIIDKHGTAGGYTLGVAQDGRPFFRIRQNLKTTELVSDSILTVNKWYTIKAVFSAKPAYLSINEKTDTTGVAGLLPLTYAPLIVGAENDLAGLFINNFNGLIDDVTLRTTVEYEDFDFIRVAIIDGNQLIHKDSLRNISMENISEFFYRFDFWRNYTNELDSVLYRHTEEKPPVWADIRHVWDNFFTVLGEQNLIIKGGYAEGTLNGIQGLNLITVGALRNGIILYYGEGFVLGVKDKSTQAHINLYQIGY